MCCRPQVINPANGEALAAAPPLPRPAYWEYPLSGPYLLLQQPVTAADSDTRLTFMVFGGGWQAWFYKPALDFSLRITVDVNCSSQPCTHAFGEWEVETMPGPRTQHDVILLPNNKVVVIGEAARARQRVRARPALAAVCARVLQHHHMLSLMSVRCFTTHTHTHTHAHTHTCARPGACRRWHGGGLLKPGLPAQLQQRAG
jgi:hypothetical protein